MPQCSVATSLNRESRKFRSEVSPKIPQRTLMNAPVVKTQMLIRKPVEEVFECFVNPDITTTFWFTKSTGKLEAGKRLRWEWEMYGVSADVEVKAIEPHRRILIEWGNPPLPVEWLFAARPDRTTMVTISNWGFQGTDDAVVNQALDSMGGFSFLLAGLKSLLEHNVQLNLVADHSPDAHKSAE
jgi:uncharacterized protein YndB with AHSA1/START domain